MRNKKINKTTKPYEKRKKVYNDDEKQHVQSPCAGKEFQEPKGVSRN